jgi:hypothetical protein
MSVWILLLLQLPPAPATKPGHRARSVLDEVNVCLDPTTSSAPSGSVGGSGVKDRSVLDKVNVCLDPTTSLAPSGSVGGSDARAKSVLTR